MALYRTRSWWSVFLLVILTVGLLTGCGGGSGSSVITPPPPPPPPTPSPNTSINIAARHMVYDSTRQRLYASVANNDASHPNTIAVIDPANAAIESTIGVGNDPNNLALSRDAKYLYVGTDGDGSVQRIDLNKKSVDLTINLGIDSTWSLKNTAGSISVMPNNSSTIAIGLSLPAVSAPCAGVVIYDNDVPRPTSVSRYAGCVDQIAISDSGDVIYGAELAESGWSLYRFDVTASGVTIRDSFASIFQGYSDGMIYASGRIYTLAGLVFDPVKGILLGGFQKGSDALTVDPAGGHAYMMLDADYGKFEIDEFDLNSYLATASVPAASGSGVFHTDLSRVNGGFAYLAFSGYPLKRSVIITKAGLTAISGPEPTLANLQVSHLVYDDVRHKIYGSVPASVGTRGNSIVVIDPATSKIEKYIAVGSEPNALGLADDRSYLYVGLNRAGSVARVDLSAQQVDLTFSLGVKPIFGLRKAVSIAPVPGAPRSVAVAMYWILGFSPPVAGIAIFDDGVERSNEAPRTFSADQIVFGSSPNVLYGIDHQYTAGLISFPVDSGGVTVGTNTKLRSVGYFNTPILWHGNEIYEPTGTIYDPGIPAYGGLFAVSGYSRGFTIDDDNNRVMFLADHGYGSSLMVQSFNKTTKVLNGAMTLPTPGGTPSDFIGCGSGCVAYATNPGVAIAVPNIPDFGAPSLVDLPVNHLLYDPTRNKVYASISGGVPTLGNSIVTIDPSTRTIEASRYVGSEPRTMGLSKDGSALYVGLDGTGTLVKMDLPSGAISSPIPMGIDGLFGPLFVNYLAVSPNDPEVVAVSRRRTWSYSPLSNGVSIVDHGTLLPVNTDTPFETLDPVVYDNAANLYSVDNETTAFTFYRLKTDSNGVSIQDKQWQLMNGFRIDIASDGDKVYSSNGYVVDPARLALAGTYRDMYGSSSFALDPANDRIYFLSYDVISRTSTISAFNKTSLVSFGSQNIPAKTGASFDLIHHPAGFVFGTADGHIEFANPTFPGLQDLPLSKLPARHMVYDALRQKIYATIPSTGGLRGNNVAVIDPVAGTVVSSVPIGSEPDTMALSGDFNYLYVGLQGASLVKRVNLNTMQVDLEFALGSSSFNGPKFAQDIQVKPGDSDTIAVSKFYETLVPPSAGVGIFTHGVELPNTLSENVGNNSLTFGDATHLYGYQNDQTSYNFNRMLVGPDGLTLQDSSGGLISLHATIKYDSGLIYSSVGTVIDPVNRNIVNTFAGVGIADAMAIDDTLNRVYFLTYDSDTKSVTITAFDKGSYQKLGSLNVQGATARGTDLVRFGSKGLAVSTSNGTVLIPTSALTN
jgi:hypothetical protein